jgi:hypothetical protein
MRLEPAGGMASARGEISPADPDARTRDRREAVSQLRSGRRDREVRVANGTR